MDIVGLISFIIIIALLGLSLYVNIVFSFKNKKLSVQLAQALVDFEMINDEFAKYMSAKNIEESESFLKFVSQSRDWAFEYIENVQDSISSLKIAVESGYPTEEELAKLFSFLPENNKEK